MIGATSKPIKGNPRQVKATGFIYIEIGENTVIPPSYCVSARRVSIGIVDRISIIIFQVESAVDQQHCSIGTAKRTIKPEFASTGIS